MSVEHSSSLESVDRSELFRQDLDAVMGEVSKEFFGLAEQIDRVPTKKIKEVFMTVVDWRSSNEAIVAAAKTLLFKERNPTSEVSDEFRKYLKEYLKQNLRSYPESYTEDDLNLDKMSDDRLVLLFKSNIDRFVMAMNVKYGGIDITQKTKNPRKFDLNKDRIKDRYEEIVETEKFIQKIDLYEKVSDDFRNYLANPEAFSDNSGDLAFRVLGSLYDPEYDTLEKRKEHKKNLDEEDKYREDLSVSFGISDYLTQAIKDPSKIDGRIGQDISKEVLYDGIDIDYLKKLWSVSFNEGSEEYYLEEAIVRTEAFYAAVCEVCFGPGSYKEPGAKERMNKLTAAIKAIRPDYEDIFEHPNHVSVNILVGLVQMYGVPLEKYVHLQQKKEK